MKTQHIQKILNTHQHEFHRVNNHNLPTYCEITYVFNHETQAYMQDEVRGENKAHSRLPLAMGISPVTGNEAKNLACRIASSVPLVLRQ